MFFNKTFIIVSLLISVSLCVYTTDAVIEIQQPDYNIFLIKINDFGSYVLTSNLVIPAGATLLEITSILLPKI